MGTRADKRSDDACEQEVTVKRQYVIWMVPAIVVLAVLVFLRKPEQGIVTLVPADEMLPQNAPTEDEHLGPLQGQDYGESVEPILDAYRVRQLFSERVRDFFAHPDALSAAAREAEATALLEQVEQFEARGELSAAEAVSLRLGLLRSSTDDSQFTAEAAQIIEDYQMRHEQAMAQYRAHPPAGFNDYKARERKIVEEVRQLESIPDGLSRGQYLRQRLQAAREESYAAAGTEE